MREKLRGKSIEQKKWSKNMEAKIWKQKYRVKYGAKYGGEIMG